MSARSQRFVAATDFSQHALWAAQRAALLAAQNGAQLELLHVVAEGPLKALRELLKARPKGVADLVDDLRQALSEAPGCERTRYYAACIAQKRSV